MKYFEDVVGREKVKINLSPFHSILIQLNAIKWHKFNSVVAGRGQERRGSTGEQWNVHEVLIQFNNNKKSERLKGKRENNNCSIAKKSSTNIDIYYLFSKRCLSFPSSCETFLLGCAAFLSSRLLWEIDIAFWIICVNVSRAKLYLLLCGASRIDN